MSETYNFNERLKRTRMQAGLSGKELAKRAGIPYSTYMAYENKNRQPLAENLAKIAAALGVSSNYLLGKTAEFEVKPNYYTVKDLFGSIDFAEKESAKNPNKITEITFNKENLLRALSGQNKVDYDIVPELERLKTKLRNSNATYGLRPIDAKTRKAFFKGLNDLIVDLLYHDDFIDDETADTGNDESEQSAPPADSDEHKEHKEHKKSVD